MSNGGDSSNTGSLGHQSLTIGRTSRRSTLLHTLVADDDDHDQQKEDKACNDSGGRDHLVGLTVDFLVGLLRVFACDLIDECGHNEDH